MDALIGLGDDAGISQRSINKLHDLRERVLDFDLESPQTFVSQLGSLETQLRNIKRRPSGDHSTASCRGRCTIS